MPAAYEIVNILPYAQFLQLATQPPPRKNYDGLYQTAVAVATDIYANNEKVEGVQDPGELALEWFEGWTPVRGKPTPDFPEWRLISVRYTVDRTYEPLEGKERIPVYEPLKALHLQISTAAERLAVAGSYNPYTTFAVLRSLRARKPTGEGAEGAMARTHHLVVERVPHACLIDVLDRFVDLLANEIVWRVKLTQPQEERVAGYLSGAQSGPPR